MITIDRSYACSTSAHEQFMHAHGECMVRQRSADGMFCVGPMRVVNLINKTPYSKTSANYVITADQFYIHAYTAT